MCVSKDVANFSKIDTTNGNYVTIGFAYAYPCGDGDFESDISVDEPISEDAEGAILNFTFNYTHCNHCGMRMRICVIVKDVDNGSIHVVGRDCGDTIAMFGTVTNRLNGASANAMKRAKNMRTRNKFLQENDGLENALKSKHRIVQSINDNFKKYFKLSEKQIALVFKLAEQQAKFDKMNANAKPIDFTKLVNAELEVVSKKEVSNMYGDSTKVLLKSAEGWKVYGTLGVRSDDVEKGDIVILNTNKVTASRDDKSFGFFSRGTIKLV